MAASSVSSALVATTVTLLLAHPTAAPAPTAAPPAAVTVALASPRLPIQPEPRIAHAFQVHRSQLSMNVDLMGPTEFAPDGSPDDVFDLVIDADQPIKHIFITYDPQGLQWDTVIGSERIPFGGFVNHDGRETWTIGVREHGVFLNSNDGDLHGALRAGHHTLELVGNSPQGDGERIVAVMFADGSVKTEAVHAGHSSRD